jgi:PAS domain-containing protein
VTSNKQRVPRVVDSIDDCAEDRTRWKDLLHVLSAMNGERSGDLTSQTTATNPAFREGTFSSLAGLLPQLHLLAEHAHRVQREYECLAIGSALKADVLNQLCFGIIIVNRCSGIQFTNRAAHEMAAERDGLRICRTRLAADHPDDNSVLAEAQDKALASCLADTPSPRTHSVSVRRHSLRQPYIVDIAPVTQLELRVERNLNPAIPSPSLSREHCQDPAWSSSSKVIASLRPRLHWL